MKAHDAFGIAMWLAVGGLVAAVVALGVRGSDFGDPPFTVEEAHVVSQLTGPESPSGTAERWNVYGSDLGFPFEHEGRLYMVFGDTWGRGGVEAGDWRSNTMAIVEPDPEQGLVITDVVADEGGEAKELLPSRKEPGVEYTILPTSAVSVGERMYLQYLSVNDWETWDDDYKHPVSNHAGLAYSDDDGHTWTEAESMRRPGDGYFAQTTFVRHEGYVYGFGTPPGRLDDLRLMRVPEEEILDREAYGYWDGARWADRAEHAEPIVSAPVGELSVEWSPYLGRWVMMYLSTARRGIVIRSAPALTGPWENEQIVLTGKQHNYLYAPFLLPGQDGPELDFTMSKFDPYQVFVLRMRLERTGG